MAGITTRAGANAYLTERFIADYDDESAHPPAAPTPAFVPLHGVDLDSILCEQEARTVGQDNVVTFDEIPLQLAKQPGRPSCAGLRVTVRRDVHGLLSVWHGPRCFGRYDGQGRPRPADRPQHAPGRLGLTGIWDMDPFLLRLRLASRAMTPSPPILPIRDGLQRPCSWRQRG